MTVVFGTDFSESATQAARAAAAIARRLGAPLKLVHVIESREMKLASELTADPSYEALRAQLRAEAEVLHAQLGVDAEPVLVSGAADEALVAVAESVGARLLVVSSLGAGDKQKRRWLVGSVAERVAQSSPIPVLVIRDPAAIEACARGERALRAMVGVDLDSVSRSALLWAAGLRSIGRVDLQVTQIAWPFWEHHRFGIGSPIWLDRLHPELDALLRRDLRAWAGELPGEGETTFTVRPGFGSVASQLEQLAAQAGVDLLVVGTHRRSLAARLWQGSVSRGVLHVASCNVACVPRGSSPADEQALPTFREVLIPTDFSQLANRAIPFGYGLVVPGGVVHLLHFATHVRAAGELDPKPQLAGLVPAGAAARGIATELHVVHDAEAFMGIWRAAGRLGVDAICMATHGRSGGERAILGSQALEVMQRARQPVVLVPPEREG